MKICKIESHTLDKDNVTLYYRIKLEASTQRAYNRFKNFIRETLDPESISGYGERTLIRGEGYHITIVRSTHYLHITATLDRRFSADIVDGMRFFDVIQKTT